MATVARHAIGGKKADPIGEWLGKNRGWIRRIVRGKVPPSDIEDVVQEVMIAAAKSWNRAEISTTRRRWVRGIIRNCAFWQRRRTQKQPNPAIDPDAFLYVLAAEHEHDTRMDARAMLAGLQASTAPERWKVWLAYTAGGTAAAIAAAEGIPIGTFYSRLRAARIDFEAYRVRERARAR